MAIMRRQCRITKGGSEPEAGTPPVTVHRRFKAGLTLRTECADAEARALRLKEVRAWFKQQFVGCDLGNVTVQVVREIKPVKLTAAEKQLLQKTRIKKGA
jgi:hypothetical protein